VEAARAALNKAEAAEPDARATLARRHALIDEARQLGAAPMLRIDAVKALDGFKREFNVAAIEFGFLGGRHWSAAEFGELIKLPSRITLLGMLAGGLAAPISGLAGVMRQKLASVIYALQAVHELKSKSDSK